MEDADDTRIDNHAAFIWSVADLLRGDYKQSEYGKVILPLTVLRRLDCVLEPTKKDVLARAAKLRGQVDNVEPVLCSVAGQSFFNTSSLDFSRLLDDPAQVAGNLRAYIAGFSSGAREVLDKFDFDTQITRLVRSDLLYLVLARFAEVDLHPDAVSNLEMGYLYEELVRRFSELSNETAGEHFTPREVIRLMVNLLFATDDDILTDPGVIKTLYDPACGSGGMLSVAEDHLRTLNPSARLEVFGQELNDETYAICRSDMMLKGQDASHIVAGNSFSDDGHKAARFDYMLANPPFGVEWKKVEDIVRTEHDTRDFQRVTVERPLRLRWEVTAQTAERLAATKQWAKLTANDQGNLASRLHALVGASTMERSAIAAKLGALPKAIEKQTWDALAVTDPEAPIVTSRKGEPEADPDLRDNENVPLPPIPVTWAADPTERLANIEYRSAVDDYIAEEVLPYVPDAWVNHAKTKIGYEIPLTRHFYKYVPPRPLGEIDAEIKALEAEIQELLREVTE
ncbi:MAG: type I restriction-modification system subunit M [Actinobacteria bacterium]|nr:type I restriction-modification system subunit M [Actinomycetota bacterium]